MPLYDLFCPACEDEVEDVFLNVSELENDYNCPSCGFPMKRKCGNAGFKLEGDGWAEDGYSKYIGDINKTRRASGKPDLTYDDIHGTNHLGNK